MSPYLILSLGGAAVGSGLIYVLSASKRNPFSRLVALAETEQRGQLEHQEESGADIVELAKLSDLLGRAGFLSNEQRRKALVLISGILLASSLGGFRLGGLTGVIIGTYFGVMINFYLLKYRAAKFRREVLFQLPLALESLILLVESGISIIPAIDALVRSTTRSTAGSPVTTAFQLLYRLSASGIAFEDASKLVATSLHDRTLRHVFLHLDVSQTAGGELIPSLRSLSDFVHAEWRLSVETRIRRLENLVVFPVFISVLGLMLVSAAVPLIPLFEMNKKMGNSNQPVIIGG